MFFGSDRFAVEPLRAVAASPHSVVAAVSRPDRRAGRGLSPVATPFSLAAEELGLTVHKPESLKDESCCSYMEEVEWDAGVVVAYGGLIPAWLLGKPARGFVNLHPSLLPRYRGAAPVERAIMGGASITGVTTMLMNERLDAGDILLNREAPMEEDDTAGTLGKRLSHMGASLLVETLERLESGGLEPVPQEEDKATTAPPVMPEEGNIDWGQPAEKIDRLVRALEPAPGAYTFFRGRRLKIHSVRVTDVPPEDEPGTLMSIGKEGFLVNTGTAGLRVITVRPEGRKSMTAGEFSRGQRLGVAERFTRGPAPEE